MQRLDRARTRTSARAPRLSGEEDHELCATLARGWRRAYALLPAPEGRSRCGARLYHARRENRRDRRERSIRRGRPGRRAGRRRHLLRSAARRLLDERGVAALVGLIVRRSCRTARRRHDRRHRRTEEVAGAAAQEADDDDHDGRGCRRPGKTPADDALCALRTGVRRPCHTSTLVRGRQCRKPSSSRDLREARAVHLQRTDPTRRRP